MTEVVVINIYAKINAKVISCKFSNAQWQFELMDLIAYYANKFELDTFVFEIYFQF